MEKQIVTVTPPTEDQTPLPAVCLYSIALSMIDINKELKATRKVHTLALRLAKQQVRRPSTDALRSLKKLSFRSRLRVLITGR